MTDQDQKLEALAKIQREILWLRDDIKATIGAIEKQLSRPSLPTAYFIGGLFTIGIVISKLTSVWTYIFTFLAWPVILGGWVADTINKLLDLLK